MLSAIEAAAREIVTVANSRDLGDVRADTIENIIQREVFGRSTTSALQAVVASRIAYLLALALVEYSDEIQGANNAPTQG